VGPVPTAAMLALLQAGGMSQETWVWSATLQPAWVQVSKSTLSSLHVGSYPSSRGVLSRGPLQLEATSPTPGVSPLPFHIEVQRLLNQGPHDIRTLQSALRESLAHTSQAENRARTYKVGGGHAPATHPQVSASDFDCATRTKGFRRTLANCAWFVGLGCADESGCEAMARSPSCTRVGLTHLNRINSGAPRSS